MKTLHSDRMNPIESLIEQQLGIQHRMYKDFQKMYYVLMAAIGVLAILIIKK